MQRGMIRITAKEKEKIQCGFLLFAQLDEASYPTSAANTVQAIPIQPAADAGFMCFAVKKCSSDNVVPKRM